MSASARRTPYTAAQWDEQKPSIHELYMEKKYPLRRVRKHMSKTTPPFTASENEYKKRFKKWGWCKYSKTAQQTRAQLPSEPLSAREPRDQPDTDTIGCKAVEILKHAEFTSRLATSTLDDAHYVRLRSFWLALPESPPSFDDRPPGYPVLNRIVYSHNPHKDLAALSFRFRDFHGKLPIPEGHSSTSKEHISVYDISTKLSTTHSYGRLMSPDNPLLPGDVDEKFKFCLQMAWDVSSPKSSIQLDYVRMRVEFKAQCRELQDLLSSLISHGESQARTLFGDLKNMRLLISIGEDSDVEFAPESLWAVLEGLDTLESYGIHSPRERENFFDGAWKCIEDRFESQFQIKLLICNFLYPDFDSDV